MQTALNNPFICITKTGQGYKVSGNADWYSSPECGREGTDQGGDVYAGWQWNGACLHAHTCRYGFYPLYYYADKTRCMLSTSLSTLVEQGADVEIDYAELAVFLRLGFHLGDKTILENVCVLPPGGKLQWSDSYMSLSGGLFLQNNYEYSRKTAISDYIDLFRQAIKRRLLPSGDYSLPLSGGRDSRHILFELDRQNSRPSFCVTTHEFPPGGMDDINVARMLCEKLGIKFVPLYQSNSRLKAELKKTQLSDYGAFEHAWSIVMAEFYKGKRQSVYDGIGGDVLSAGLYLDSSQQKLYQERRYDEVALRMLKGWQSYHGYEKALRRVLPAEIVSKIRLEVAIEGLASELAKHAESPSPISSFYFWNRTRRCIALYSLRILPQTVNVYMPYLDSDLYDFLASLPISYLSDKSLHDDVIAAAYPQYSGLPYEDKAHINYPSHWHIRRYLIEAALYISRKSTNSMVNREYIVPRTIQYALYRTPVIKNWLATETAVYLTQLEEMIA